MTAQRWLFGRDSYRPAGETIDTRHFEVDVLTRDTDAKRFVLDHHYAGTYPAARFRFGLYRSDRLVGVAVFSHPCSDKVLTSVFDAPVPTLVELGRFVLLDEVPGNGETWFLARCFDVLRRAGLRGVVSFSDPMARTTADGAQVFGGHIGTIYQAHNGRYLGRGTVRTLRLLPDGQVLSARAIQKARAGERGAAYACEQLVRAGAPGWRDELLDQDARRAAWLATALTTVTRTVRHPGNHRYAWPLDRRQAVLLPTLPYPKQVTHG